MGDKFEFDEKNSIDSEKTAPISNIKEIMELTEKCICKIKCNEGRIGTGFFCNIIKEGWESMKVLMTNNHIINKNDINIGKKLQISIKNEKEVYEIEVDKDRKVYTNEDFDITIIEIKKNDGIKLDSFLEIDKNIFNDNINEIYENESIYLLNYPKGEEMNFVNGIIYSICKYIIGHTCEGCSGGPLINSTKFQVIGIHKGGAKGAKHYNYGTLIKEPIEQFKKTIIENTKNNLIKKEKITDNDNNNKTKINGNEINENNKKYIFENGEYYIGEWSNYLGHGKGKIYNEKNQIKYDGDFVKGKYEGRGTYFYENRDYYIGNWLNGLRHGKGTLYNKKNKMIYEGDFVKGKKEGNGKYIYENGEYYIGEWLNNLKHGKGIIYYNDNSIKYEGDFVKGEYEGTGKKIYKNGEFYIGEWLAGLRHGNGVLYNKDNKIIYKGNFEKDKFNGFGKYIWDSGEYYAGEWLNDLRHGKGTIFYKDNTVKYEGNFIKDKFEGRGKYIWENGQYYIGEFSNGSTHGKGTLYNKDNTIIYDGKFVKGEYPDKCRIF